MSTNGHPVRPLERVLGELAADGIEAHVNGDRNMSEESARALGSIMRAAAQKLLDGDIPLTGGQKAKRLELIKERHRAYLLRRKAEAADEESEEYVDDLYAKLTSAVAAADERKGVLQDLDEPEDEEIEIPLEEAPPLDMVATELPELLEEDE